ncbi:DUF5658 family protein [Bacillus massilinigeriensis]|uniref:DUF5658 family protein n=1 Tax=Bacillus massilionigeriensis TaxID=1805475 RepID=UPI00096B55A9
MNKILLYVGFLNIFDSLATYLGLLKSLIEEENPLMNHLFQIHPILFLTIKMVLSLSLFLLISYKNLPQTNLLHLLSWISAFLYTIVFVTHLLWIVWLPIY